MQKVLLSLKTCVLSNFAESAHIPYASLRLNMLFDTGEARKAHQDQAPKREMYMVSSFQNVRYSLRCKMFCYTIVSTEGKKIKAYKDKSDLVGQK